ncbi:MAG: VWA domain-containing protein [Acidobacteria bacterium]|nr:VWA domain-containing protein [Acidobacteriota bacterium]
MKKLFTVAVMLGASLCYSALALAQTPPPKQDPQKSDEIIVFTGSSLVNVNVIVTDRYGRLVTGLAQSNFQVREDGALQKVDKFFAQSDAFSVVLLIDTSRSTARKLGAIQKAAENFIKQLQPRDRVMVITFDDRLNTITDFTGDASALKKAVKAARTGYATRLYDAINYAIAEKLNPLSGRRAIVVLTDGVDTASKQASYDSTLDLVASSNIITYAIQYETRNEGINPLRPLMLPGIPNGASLLPRFDLLNQLRQPQFSFASAWMGWTQPIEWQDPKPQPPAQQPPPYINIPRTSTTIIGGTERDGQPAQRPTSTVQMRDRYLIAGEYLGRIAQLSGARHLRADSIENTSYAFQLIADELRNLYTIDYYSENQAKDGKFRSIAVNLNPAEFTVRTRPGYRAPKEAAEPTAKPNSKP